MDWAKGARQSTKQPSPYRIPHPVNLNKSRAATAELNRTNFDVALIQEPNMGRKATISLLELPKRSFCKENARAAVIIGERVKYRPVESLSSRDLAVIAVVLERGFLFLASGYQYIMLPVVSPELNRLQKYCRDVRIPLIIGMDSNAHSSVWGEEESNHRGGGVGWSWSNGSWR